MKIHKIERDDEIGNDNGWSLWRCEVEMEDGSTRMGFVQGDEHSTAEETLELDDDDGPSDAQQELSRAGAEAANMRYRQSLQDAGRSHLLPP